MPVFVLLRASKRTGKVNKCMTGITSALMTMWALNNTPKTMITLIIERDTGIIKECFTGTADGMPKREKIAPGTSCEEFGISNDDLKQITDSRFD